MESINLLETLSIALVGQSFAQELLDLLVKSTVIVGLTYTIAQIFRSKLSNNGTHLLWLTCLFCVAFLPLAGATISTLTSSFVGQSAFNIITVQAGIAEPTQASAVNSNLIIIAVYMMVTIGFLTRLLLSAIGLRRISKSARLISTGTIAEQLVQASGQLGITRTVVLKLSDRISSPMSFGALQPVVILPSASASWSASTLEDVLLHELSHIKRLDWPSILFCHLLSSLFWINPLVWFAKERVNEAAEKACDSAVLTHGKDGINYAEDLLRFARLKRGNQEPVLAQLMFEESGLSIRIRNILDGNLTRKINKAFLSTMIAYAALSIVTFSNINVFGASDDEPDQEYLPITAIAPQYPTRAASQGIEGWALVSFTVTEDGSVDESSLLVLDAEPAEIFDRSSLRAAARFTFQPRISGGIAIPVPGVQYLFTYTLENDGIMEDAARQPPQARK